MYLGIKSVRVPTTGVETPRGDTIKLLLACETGMRSELKQDFFENEEFQLTREVLFIEDDRKEETPLVKLARHGYVEESRKFVEVAEASSIEDAAKYYINLQDKKGKSAIFYAAEYGHKDLVDFFLTRGANPMQTDAEGGTVLHVACHSAKTKEHAEVIQTILSHEKVSPSHNKKLKQRLIDAKDAQGRQALHIVSYKEGAEDVMNALLMHGADAMTKDLHGKTPSDLAGRSGRRKSKDLLEEFIASQAASS